MALVLDFCLVSIENWGARSPNDCPVKVGSALVENLRPREHKERGICLLIYDGGVAMAKISGWLQVHGTGSSHYASICGADGNTWAEKGTSPHCTPNGFLDGARTEGWPRQRLRISGRRATGYCDIRAPIARLSKRRPCRTGGSQARLFKRRWLGEGLTRGDVMLCYLHVGSW